MTEPPAFYRRVLVRGRKAYTCCECGTTLAAGEQHYSCSGKWGERVTTFRTCRACKELIDQIDASDPFEPTPFGELVSTVARIDEEANWPEVQAFRERAALSARRGN